MKILREYRMGQNTARLIAHNWDSLIFFMESRFLGTAFGAGRDIKKGDPSSPMIFNIVVDAVLRAVLEVVCGPQEARHRMGWAA